MKIPDSRFPTLARISKLRGGVFRGAHAPRVWDIRQGSARFQRVGRPARERTLPACRTSGILPDAKEGEKFARQDAPLCTQDACAPFSSAFTLLELMVAASVLVMLVLMVAQIVQSGSMVISGSRKHLGADAQAREVFSRFDLDLGRMPKRPDMDAVLSSSNNAIFFFSEAPGFFTSTDAADRGTLALVGYRVNANAQLERLGKGLSWTTPLFLTYTTNAPTTNSTPLPASTIDGAWSSVIGSPPGTGLDDDYHLLADGVFRIFYYFQKKDGTFSPFPGTNAIQGQFHDVTAIVLTLAILESDSRKIVSDTSRLASALGDPTQSDLDNKKLPAQLWQDKVNNTSTFAAAAGIPPKAASRVRIYQRSFPLNTP